MTSVSLSSESFIGSLLVRFVLNLPRSLWRALQFQDSPSEPQPPRALSSSRPPPPSPAPSRRQSRNTSRPVSAMTSAAPSRPLSTSGSNLQPPQDRTTTPTPSPPCLIHIRDFAFAPSDPRFTGHGPNVPRANRPAFLARRLASSCSASTSSTSSDDDWEDDEEADEPGTAIVDVPNAWVDVVDDGPDGWSSIKWVWGFGRTSGLASNTAFPTRGELDRNFGGDDDESYGDMQIDPVEAFSDDEGEGETPLVPGLYRALYAFEPEGTAEMRLEEDQLVRVIGSGGGVGWAVVVKDGLKDMGVHALVPESYLEPMGFDGEDEDA